MATAPASTFTASSAVTTSGDVLPEPNLETVDFVVIGVYFALILAVGIWVGISPVGSGLTRTAAEYLVHKIKNH